MESIELIKNDGTSATYSKIDERATSGQANIFTVRDHEGNEAILKMYLRSKPSSLEDLELQDKGAAREIRTLILAKEQKRNDIPEILDFGYVKPGFMNALPAVVMKKNRWQITE